MIETRQQTEDAFENLPYIFFNNIIKHCHDWIDSFLQTDAAEDLQQCGTLAGVIKHHKLLKAAETITDNIAHMEISPLPPTHPVPPSSADISLLPVRTLRPRR